MYVPLVLSETEAALVGRFFTACTFLVQDAVLNSRAGDKADGILLEELPEIPENLRVHPGLKAIAPGMAFLTKKSLLKNINLLTGKGTAAETAKYLFDMVSEHATDFSWADPVPQTTEILREACQYLGEDVEGMEFVQAPDFKAPRETDSRVANLNVIEDLVDVRGTHIGAHLYTNQLRKTWPGAEYRYFREKVYTRHQFAVMYIINWFASGQPHLIRSAQGEAMLWKLRTPRMGMNGRNAVILTKNPHKPVKFR